MAGANSKLRRDITPKPDADPLLGSPPLEAPAVVGYLASFAITALATFVAVGVDREVTIPNLSLIFVVPVIITGVGFGLGPSLFSAVLGALASSAREGAGVAQLPLYACADDLKSSRLQRVFEDFDPAPTPVHLLSLSGMALTATTRGVVHGLRKQLASVKLPGVVTNEL